MTPAQNHYLRLIEDTAPKWDGLFSSIKVASDRTSTVTKVASPLVKQLTKLLRRGGEAPPQLIQAVREGVKSGKISFEALPSSVQAELKRSSAKSPVKSMLLAGGAGATGGYLAGKRSGESDSRGNAAAGFGAGIATGLAAPTILSGLNQIVSNQGLMPGGYAPTDAEYYMQI